MDHTARLALPFIMPNQAQKHVTHNEAIQALDALVQPAVESRTLATPPTLPLAGEAYIVPVEAEGLWAGHGNEIAAFQSGAWQFQDPAAGWQVWVKAEKTHVVFDAGAWVPLASLGAGLPQLGVHTSADSTNRLAVAAAATLLTHDGQGHQLKINKATPGDTASLLYQTNWSGRAEMGLSGDDNWHIKVSPDGAGWIEALTVHAATGVVTVGTGLRPAVDNALSLGAAGARWAMIWSATGTIQTSDERQKTDIELSDLGLEVILELLPVKFRRTGESRMHYGLLAQQVQDALAGKDFAGHVLADPGDPESEQGLRYDSFIAPLIMAMHQLDQRIKWLEEDVRA
jgi:hypothetical protein